MKQNDLKTKRYDNKNRMRLHYQIKDLIFTDQDLLIAKQYYSIKQDKDIFKYYQFTDTSDYLDYIKKNENTELFENIRFDIPKIYFDIDLPTKYKTEGIYRKEVDYIITEIVRHFNLYFDKEITINDLLIYTRQETDKMIRSIHIIIPKYRTHKHTIKKFVEYANAKQPTYDDTPYIRDCISKNNNIPLHEINNLFGNLCVGIKTPILSNNLYLDNQVYHNDNQNLCLPYQTKLAYNKKRVLIPYNKITRLNESVEKYCCNSISDCIENTTGEVYDSIMDLVDKVENSFTAEEYEIVNKTNQPNKDDEDTIKLNEYTLIKYLLNKLPKNFFSKNGNWCKYTSYLKLYGIENIDEWIEMSAEYSNGEYTTEDNKKWIDNLDNKYPNKNINTFIQKCIGGLNSDYPSMKIYFEKRNNYDTPQLREWISKTTDIPIQKINNLFNHSTPSEKRIYLSIGKDWKLYITALDLVNVKTNEKVNYWINEVYSKVNENIPFNTNDEIYNKLTEFLSSVIEKIFNINAKWGSGKTHIFIKSAIETAIKNGWRVLLISENNVLNRSITNQLSAIYPNMVKNHISLKPNTKFCDDDRICISSTESIQKTNGGTFDLVILDEYESILNHYESLDTHKYTTPYKSIGILENKLKLSQKIINLDADLSIERLQPLYNILEISTPPTIYYSDMNKWKEYTFNIYFKEYEMIQEIINSIKNGKRISIACMSKTKAIQIDEYIRQTIKDTKTLCVWSDICKMNGEDIENSDLLKDNIETEIQKNKIQVWIYSPSVKTGLSINTEKYFHQTYMITKAKKSCCGREALQMIFRTRDLIDKSINIFLPRLKHIKTPPTMKRAELHLTSNLSLSQIADDTPINTDLNKIQFDTNEFYKSIRCLNIIEWYVSDCNLGHEILRRLTKNHSIQVNIIHEEKTSHADIHESLKEIKKDLKLNMIKTLNNTPLIDKTTRKKNELEIRNRVYTAEMINQNKKRYLFNTLGVNTDPYYYTENDRIERYGKEFYSEDGKIRYNKIDYTNIIDSQDGIELSKVYDILLSDKHQIIRKINTSNRFGSQKAEMTDESISNSLICDEPAINNKNQAFIKWNCDRRILTKLLPQIYNTDNTINLNGFDMKVIEFNKTMKDHTEHIQETFNYYELVYSVKESFDWTKFNPSNSNHKKKYYQFLQSIIKKYGLELKAPINKTRDNDKYRCVKKRHEIEKDHHIPFIHTEYHNKNPIETENLLIGDSDIMKDYISISNKTGKITTNKTKKQREMFNSHPILKQYTEPIQLYKRFGNKWTKIKTTNKEETINNTLLIRCFVNNRNTDIDLYEYYQSVFGTDPKIKHLNLYDYYQSKDDLECKIVGKLTILKTYEDNTKEIDTNEYEKTEHKKLLLNYVKDSILTHYSKFRIRPLINEDHQDKFYDKYKKAPYYKQDNTCLITDSDDEDDDYLLDTEEHNNQLNKNITESDTESNDNTDY